MSHFIGWCNSNSGFLSVIIAVITAVTTVFVLGANRKAVRLSQKSLQKMMNLGLYERSLQIANNIESVLYINTLIEIEVLLNKSMAKQVAIIKALTTRRAGYALKKLSIGTKLTYKDITITYVIKRQCSMSQMRISRLRLGRI